MPVDGSAVGTLFFVFINPSICAAARPRGPRRALFKFIPFVSVASPRARAGGGRGARPRPTRASRLYRVLSREFRTVPTPRPRDPECTETLTHSRAVISIYKAYGYISYLCN